MAARLIASTIHVYVCLECGFRVSIDVSPEGNTTLNSYQLPELATKLADRLDAGRPGE